jgi:hypothetical protein
MFFTIAPDSVPWLTDYSIHRKKWFSRQLSQILLMSHEVGDRDNFV